MCHFCDGSDHHLGDEFISIHDDYVTTSVINHNSRDPECFIFQQFYISKKAHSLPSPNMIPINDPIYHIQTSSLNDQIRNDTNGFTTMKTDQLIMKNKLREQEQQLLMFGNINESKSVDSVEENNTFFENLNKTGTNVLIRKTNTEDEDEPDYKLYRFQDSGDGKSWQIGDDSTVQSNAYKEGLVKCPPNIIVPRSLTNEENVTKPVEVIGEYAYSFCGSSGGTVTKTVFVTKQVRIIKYYGFGSMDSLESFKIEEGSVLETIESNGLFRIGQSTGRDDPNKRGTLVLPSTLSSVARNGIYLSSLFNVIIYCGTHSLTNDSQLEMSVERTKVMVTNEYSADTIFGRTPLKDFPEEVQGNCSRMELRPTPPNVNKGCSCSSEGKTLPSVLFPSLFLIDSDYDSNFYLQIDREFIEENSNKGGRRGSRKGSLPGFDTEVFLVIKSRKRGHMRGVNRNQIINSNS